MKSFQRLSMIENKALLKFPAYITLLAANSDGKLDKAEEKAAVKLSHIKTFSSDPHLTEFYAEADKGFVEDLEELDNSLPEGRDEREKVIKSELTVLEKIVTKLGEEDASIMHKSMKSFKEHVSKSYRNVLVDFIFPMPLEGITD